MSKVICDICGTSYPDTATQCPICGSVRPAEASPVSDDGQESAGYTYVKGGRFSKSNVRKRNQSAAAAVTAASKKNQGKAEQGEKAPVDNKRISLIIVLVCLLLIVIAMFAYIAITMSGQGQKPDSGNQGGTSAAVSCTSLKVTPLEFMMTKKNEGLKLEVEVLPADCSDRPLFESSDVNVVTVDASGNVVCVGSGKAVITVTCGQQKKECRVTCTVEETEDPAAPNESDPVPTVSVRLMRYNITDADFAGKMYDLYAEGDVSKTELTWVSEDTSVATVDNTGKVYTVGNGETDIHAKYEGVIVATCHIKCEFKDPEVDNSQESGDEAAEFQFGTIADGYTNPLSVEWDGYYGVTLGVGQKFKFGLIHKSDSSKNICFEWERVNPNDTDTSVSVSEDKLWITRTEAGSSPYCLFVATYNGTKYYLRIR